jgi:hypothetical protein
MENLMSLVRFGLVFLVAIAFSGNTHAQNDTYPNYTYPYTELDASGVIRTGMGSLGVDIETEDALEAAQTSEAPDIQYEKLINTAKEIGLDGRWVVTTSEKDGGFSLAQIGQESGDQISFLPRGKARPLLAIG